MDLSGMKEIVTVSATVIAIVGGLLGLVKFFSDKREVNIKEWQKVVIQKLFEQSDDKILSFGRVLEKYRSEAQAFAAYNLKKGEISEDSLRRVLIELTASNILCMKDKDAYKLNIDESKIDQYELQQKMNSELVKIIGASPFVYTLDEVAKQIGHKLGIEFQLVKGSLKLSIDQDLIEEDEKGRIAFSS